MRLHMRKKCKGFPHIDSTKSPDGHVLQSNREIRDAFQAHFRDRFACCLDLLLQEFRSYLADFPHLGAAEAADCIGWLQNTKFMMC